MSTARRKRVRRDPVDVLVPPTTLSHGSSGGEGATRPLRGEPRAVFLSEAGALLAASLDYETTLQRVADLVVPALADACVIDLVQSDDTLRHVAVAHDAATTELLRGVQDARRDLSPAEPVARVLREGAALLIPHVPGRLLRRIARNEQHLSALRTVAPRSLAVVPLRARGRTLGSMSLILSRDGERYGPEDLALAEELAMRVALAVDNARLYAQAQQASRSRDDILGIVSHDLRNPLGVVIMGTQTLLEERIRDEQQREYLELIRRAAERMQRLIEDLLQVTFLESGRLQLQVSAQSPAVLADDVVRAFDMEAAGRSIRLESEVPPDLPSVLADRDRVLQLFTNLVDNALKFTPPGGRIVLSASRSTEDVEFSISDTGPGLPADELPHLFDRFWQARRSRIAGVGLGLAIARGIVEAHGGLISAGGAEGGGAVFRFTLPTAAGGTVASPGTAR